MHLQTQRQPDPLSLIRCPSTTFRQSEQSVHIMLSFRLSITLLLLSLELTKACSGKVTSCLQCFSGPGHEDPDCAEGRGKGWEPRLRTDTRHPGLPCGAGFDGCYVAANENRSGGYWDRGCCTRNKTEGETRCLEIHEDTGVGRTDQSWWPSSSSSSYSSFSRCDTDNCNTMDPRRTPSTTWTTSSSIKTSIDG